jgi:hypothetical protein
MSELGFSPPTTARLYEPAQPPCAVSRRIGRTATIEAGRAPLLAGPHSSAGLPVSFWATSPFSFQPTALAEPRAAA